MRGQGIRKSQDLGRLFCGVLQMVAVAVGAAVPQVLPKGADVLDQSAVIVAQIIAPLIGRRLIVGASVFDHKFCLIISVLAVCHGLLVVVRQDDVSGGDGER